MVIPIEFDALGTVPKGLERRLEAVEIGGQIQTIQTIAYLRSARILQRVQETSEVLLSFKLH